MSATLTGKWGDDTFGQFRIGFLGGGLKVELVSTEFSNDVSASNTMPSTFVRLLGLHGQICATQGCVSGLARVITNYSLCTGPVLEISVGDISEGASSDRHLNYTAWGW